MVTLKDVAKEAGLTVTTVSRVLNNRGYISEEARTKVNEAMAKLKYQPNEVARSLHNKKTNTIGVIVPHIKHPYFSEMISNIENQAYKQGYRIQLCNSQEKQEKEKAYIDVCKSNRVAGIIIFSGSVNLAELAGLDIPIIAMEREIDSAISSVECDNEYGGQLAANRLIDAGCKRLLFIGSTTADIRLPADDRAIGFRKVCQENNIPYIEIDPEKESYEEMSYQDMLRHTLEKNHDIDGIFASSDVIAAQSIQVCSTLGIRVPEDVKIVGFDDTIIAQITNPMLTTIHQPIKEMAEVAVKLLKDASDNKIIPKQTILPTTLVEREST